MKRRLWAVIACGVFLLAATDMSSAEGTAVQIRDVQTAGHPTIGVTITSESELDPAGVRVAENGRPVDVLNVRPLLETGQAIEIVLAIDTSQSVKGAPLAAALEAARQFVSAVPAPVGVGIVTFSDRARILIPVTADHSKLLEALVDLTQTRRGTALFDAVSLASGMFSVNSQHNLVLLTDGVDSRSTLDLQGAVATAAEADVAVFTVGLKGTRSDFSSLESISAATGGRFSEVSSPDLSSIYTGLAQELSHQYLVLYRSGAPGGGQVTISVITPAGQDTSTVLIPRPRPVAAPEVDRGPLFPIGPAGLAIALLMTFLAAFLLLTMVLGAEARRRRDRILARRMAAPAIPHSGVPARPDFGPTAWMPETFVQAADVVASAAGVKSSLSVRLERAGLAMTPGEVVAGAIVTGVAGLIIGGLLFRSLMLGLLIGAITAAVPFLLVSRRMHKRLGDLNDQLPDILMTLASSMRAGHSFLQAIDTVAKEIGEPAGPEFNRVVTELRLGRPFEEGMTALAERVGTEEFKWAVLAINVQREVGGNLAEVLDTLAETVRDRDFIRRQVRVLSAEGRLSVKILIGMPFLLALYLTWANPAYVRLLWTTHVGWFLLVAGGILMLVGAVWARKVVRIDV